MGTLHVQRPSLPHPFPTASMESSAGGTASPVAGSSQAAVSHVVHLPHVVAFPVLCLPILQHLLRVVDLMLQLVAHGPHSSAVVDFVMCHTSWGVALGMRCPHRPPSYIL